MSDWQKTTVGKVAMGFLSGGTPTTSRADYWKGEIPADLLDLKTELWDYVIVHELLHFFIPNHGKLWKSLMLAHLGEYQAYEAELKQIAHDKRFHRCPGCLSAVNKFCG